MFERFHSKTMTATAAALLSALGVGGIAVAQSSHGSTKAPAKAAQSAEVPGQESTTGPDTDNIQSGDQTSPDTATVSSKTAKASQSTEAPGTEAPDSGTEAPEAPGSETPDASDGPGGHADEPGNPNAQNEAQGAQ
jgi:hypothetical protein